MSKDKARAVILGMACGDALGAPVEGWTALEIAQKTGLLTDIKPPADLEKEIREAHSERALNAIQRKISVLRMPGLYTDGTQQALILAEMLALHQEENLQYLAAMYLKFSAPIREGELGIFRGAGPDFKTVAERLRLHIS